jgi:hypothetical protein
MEPSRLSRNDWIVVAGAVLMFIALFFAWFRVAGLDQLIQGWTELARRLGAGDAVSISNGVSGWKYSAAIAAWLVTLLAAVVVLVKAIPDLRLSLPLSEGLLVLGLGVAAFVIVLLRTLLVPSSMSRAGGVYVALIATLVVAIGGFLKNAETS